MLASPALSRFVLQDSGQPLYFRLFFLIYIAQTAELVPFLMCRALQRSKLVVMLNLLRLLALLSLNVVFVVYLRTGVVGILISNLIVSSVLAAGMLVFLFRTMGTHFSWPKFRAMARFAYPVAFVSIGNFFLVFSDRYFLNHYVGPAAVGLYSLAYRFGFILSAFVFNPFQQIWGPQRFAIAKQPNARETFRRVFLYINIALGVAALGIALFARDLLRVMATYAFVGAHQVVPLILLAQILHHWTAYNNLGLFLTKTTTKFAWGSAVGIPAVLGLNFLLIPRYGVWGAAIATILAYTLRFLVIQHLSQREYPIDYDWPRIVRLYTILVLAFVVRAVLGDLGVVPSVLIGFALACLASWGVYTLVLNSREQHALVDLVRSRVFPWSRKRAARADELTPENTELPVEA
jgi:O-antigen/teichoic acid export membrane protein